MASSKEYLTFVLDQLSGLNGISFRGMMGEYILYHNGKIVGGIYDDRLLVKPVQAARQLMPDAPFEIPYDGAKEMLSADGADRELLNALIPALAADLLKQKLS